MRLALSLAAVMAIAFGGAAVVTITALQGALEQEARTDLQGTSHAVMQEAQQYLEARRTEVEHWSEHVAPEDARRAAPGGRMQSC